VRRIGFLCLAATVSAVAMPPARAEEREFAPFAFADIEFDPQCRPNAALERVLAMLGGINREVVTEAVADTPLQDVVSGDASLRWRLDRPVDWHGLHLVALEHEHGIERGPSNYRLVFADPPVKVREVWNARGWNLPPVNEPRDVAGLENYAAIMVSSEDGGRAAVTCFRD
jgi:hypothetical protein